MKKNCLYCGKAFETVRQNQQTCCSNACKTKYKIDVSRKFQEYIKSADGSLDLKTDPPKKKPKEIGRASCRERV